tara:strand:+ start:532 stop:1047 length:516 start_codon:yes stop_codon:yes gene_type:complete
MAALGALVERRRSYNEVSREVRQFAARIVGPSLDLLGTSIELLKLEGLIETVELATDDSGEILELSDHGLEELKEYLKSNVRSGGSDLNRLVVALKLRFLTVLDVEEQIEQLISLRDMYEAEKIRLLDLEKQSQWLSGLLPELIHLEIGVADDRIRWCSDKIDETVSRYSA